eukprot:12341696-Prorocentrum_lima.AAC.1
MTPEDTSSTQKWAAYYSWKWTRDARMGKHDHTIRADARYEEPSTSQPLHHAPAASSAFGRGAANC